MTENAVSAAGNNTRMVTSLVRLNQALREVNLPLALDGAEQVRAAQTAMVDQLEAYVIPRVMTIDAPLLAVVGGSTGAGKSTLVNSLVGTRVTASGLLRPTTRSPVLVHHPDDGGWFGQDRLLPDLRRVPEPTTDPHALQLVASVRLHPGLAVLDAPDVDSVEEQNRVLAASLLASADLWLFVTSAARYADQVPWEFLKAAAERSAAVAVVLDRTPADAVDTVAAHLARMMASRGLKDSPLFIVNEGEVSPEGVLPAEHVAEIRAWLDMLADDAVSRQAVVTQTLEGVIRGLTLDVHEVADAADRQREAADGLRTVTEQVYTEAIRAATVATTDGTLLRGEVLARWRELVGTGDLVRGLESTVGKLRERVVGAIRGKPQHADRVGVAIESGLELLVWEYAESTAERMVEAWASTAAGRSLLDLVPVGLGRADPELRGRVQRAVREWQQEVLGLVRDQGRDKRASAKFLAYGVPGLGAALMVATLGGGPGAGGPSVESAALGRSLLDAVFGAQVAQSLTARAQASLTERVGVLLHQERNRHMVAIDSLEIDPGAPARVRAAIRGVDDARVAGHAESNY